MILAVIGGSGFYSFMKGKQKTYETPFGISGAITAIDDPRGSYYFLVRHGARHTVPPHLVNYRANIYALSKLGVTHILATNAVGSCVPEMKPGDFVVPDQLLDFTWGRGSTFYEGTESAAAEFAKVKHTDVTSPYEGDVRNALLTTLRKHDEPYHERGTYVCSNGPRFETAAEVSMFKQLGGHLLGMTSAPEAFLARELGIDYATLCLVTNFGAGMQDSITHEEVLELFQEKMPTLRSIISDTISVLLQS